MNNVIPYSLFRSPRLQRKIVFLFPCIHSVSHLTHWWVSSFHLFFFVQQINKQMPQIHFFASVMSDSIVMVATDILLLFKTSYFHCLAFVYTYRSLVAYLDGLFSALRPPMVLQFNLAKEIRTKTNIFGNSNVIDISVSVFVSNLITCIQCHWSIKFR